MKNANNTPKTVGCNVKDCRYHSAGDFCHAESIHVSNERAREKAETFCATFENKTDI